MRLCVSMNIADTLYLDLSEIKSYSKPMPARRFLSYVPDSHDMSGSDANDASR